MAEKITVDELLDKPIYAGKKISLRKFGTQEFITFMPGDYIGKVFSWTGNTSDLKLQVESSKGTFTVLPSETDSAEIKKLVTQERKAKEEKKKAEAEAEKDFTTKISDVSKTIFKFVAIALALYVVGTVIINKSK